MEENIPETPLSDEIPDVQKLFVVETPSSRSISVEQLDYQIESLSQRISTLIATKASKIAMRDQLIQTKGLDVPLYGQDPIDNSPAESFDEIVG